MGGCTNCKGKAGCDDHKGQMMGTVDSALADLYPTRTWGEPTTSGRARHARADELARRSPTSWRPSSSAATFVRDGGDDEPCDYIYVLCLGRTPCVVQVRDHGVERPTSGASPTRSRSFTCVS